LLASPFFSFPAASFLPFPSFLAIPSSSFLPSPSLWSMPSGSLRPSPSLRSMLSRLCGLVRSTVAAPSALNHRRRQRGTRLHRHRPSFLARGGQRRDVPHLPPPTRLGLAIQVQPGRREPQRRLPAWLPWFPQLA